MYYIISTALDKVSRICYNKSMSGRTTEYQTLRDFYNIHIFGRQMTQLLKGCTKILELGCERNSLLYRAGFVHKMDVTGVDIFKPHVEYHKEMGIYKRCICTDVTKLKFDRNEFDAVVCMDVIEHIPKMKVLESGLLENMKRWARKVIITTPNGYVWNPYYDDNIHTIHRSGWSANELRGFGYKVKGLSGWKPLRTTSANIRFRHPFLFWVVVSVASELVTYHLPEQSWHLLGTYRR